MRRWIAHNMPMMWLSFAKLRWNWRERKRQKRLYNAACCLRELQLLCEPEKSTVGLEIQQLIHAIAVRLIRI